METVLQSSSGFGIQKNRGNCLQNVIAVKVLYQLMIFREVSDLPLLKRGIYTQDGNGRWRSKKFSLHTSLGWVSVI